MPSTINPDPRAQFREAFLATRENLRHEHQAALAAQASAEQVRSVHQRTLAETEDDLTEAQARLVCAARLERALLDTHTLATDASARAGLAHETANATATATTAAATAVTATTTAIEETIANVSRLAGVTQSNDIDEPVNVAVQKAVMIATKTGRAAEELKMLALTANVAAAQATSALVRDSAAANARAGGELFTQATQQTAPATDAVHTANRQRAAAAAALHESAPPPAISLAQTLAVQQAIEQLDRLSQDRNVRRPDHDAPSSARDSDAFVTAKLRELTIARTSAEQKLTATRASVEALRARQRLLQARAEADAPSSLAADEKNLRDALSRTAKLAAEAKTQSVVIDQAVERVHRSAHALTLDLLATLQAIDMLADQIARRQGKNELISSVVVSGAAEAQANAVKALQLAIAAWQKLVAALVASKQARAVAADAAEASAQAFRFFAAEEKGARRVKSGRVDSWAQLAKAFDRETPSPLLLLNATASTARIIARRQVQALTKIERAVATAADLLDRAQLGAQTATAALVAAEKSVG